MILQLTNQLRSESGTLGNKTMNRQHKKVLVRIDANDEGSQQVNETNHNVSLANSKKKKSNKSAKPETSTRPSKSAVAKSKANKSVAAKSKASTRPAVKSNKPRSTHAMQTRSR